MFELAFSHFPKAVCISGMKPFPLEVSFSFKALLLMLGERDIQAAQVQQMLGVGVVASAPNAKPQPTPQNR